MRIFLCVLAVLFAFAPGCARTLDRAPVAVAQPVPNAPERPRLTSDGHIYFAGQPDEALLRRMADEHEVTTVINIRTPEAMREHVPFDEERVVREEGMEYVNIPLGVSDLSEEDLDAFDGVLSKTRGPALLHCASSNTVGGVWAIYLHERRGIPAEEAYEMGQGAGLSRPASIETVRKRLGLPIEAAPPAPAAPAGNP